MEFGVWSLEREEWTLECGVRGEEGREEGRREEGRRKEGRGLCGREGGRGLCVCCVLLLVFFLLLVLVEGFGEVELS